MSNDSDTKCIRIEYEFPMLRAIYFAQYHDDGQSDDEVREAFAAEQPRARVRKIERLQDSV
jgi:hypothetical protein